MNHHRSSSSNNRVTTLLGGVVLLFCGMAAFVSARPSCQGLSNGYYCTSNATAHYYWCYGQEYPVEGECTAPLVCGCGFTAQNPCVWAGTKPSDCKGAPGDFLTKEDGGDTDPSQPGGGGGGDDSGPTTTPDEEYINGIYAMSANKHVPLALYFDAANWRGQLKAVMAEAFFDDAGQYTPSPAGYMCSFHPPPKYDQNPTQLWIGRPSGTMTISYTPGITMRLPDKYLGLYLGYAMDQYGLNPSMLLALAAKESFLPVIWAAEDKAYFIVEHEDEHYNCYSASKNGLCTDGNLDGPFQVETGGMSTDVASFPHRFYTGDAAVPKDQRAPSYLTDNEFLQQSGFRAFHDSYTLHMGKAVVLTALDFHFRHNLLWTMRKSGLYSAMQKRDRDGQDSLEFAAMMYTYNRGVFDTQLVTMLGKCTASMNPTECGLDGYGGHTTDIRTACKLLDEVPASEVYDWTVAEADLTQFLDVLEETYPYHSIPGVQDAIDWAQLRSDAREAFAMLRDHRAAVAGATKYPSGISFRYDWRALLAVVRMHLPPREAMLGPSVQNFANYWGTTRTPELAPTVDPDAFPLAQCCLAGGRDDVCSGVAPPTPTPSPSPSPVPPPSSSGEPGVVDKCPSDPDKTEPGVCGCGVPETTWCCSKEAYARCDAEVAANHKTNNECNTLMKWGRCLVNNGCSNGQLMMNALARCRPCRKF